jgi:RNA polymerase sigma factor (sigma-70 family)
MLLLIQGCKRNDRDSQRLLYQHYYGYAFSICTRYCRTTEEAKEVVNDGFLKVFLKIGQYDAGSSFKGWLRRIMINTSIDWFRKEQRHYYLESLDEPMVENLQAMGTYDELSYKELIAMIQKLSPGYRAVFNLYVIDGYTHKEIGAMLGISEGTSKSNLLKARERLKKVLSKLKEKVYAKSV